VPYDAHVVIAAAIAPRALVINEGTDPFVNARGGQRQKFILL